MFDALIKEDSNLALKEKEYNHIRVKYSSGRGAKTRRAYEEDGVKVVEIKHPSWFPSFVSSI